MTDNRPIVMACGHLYVATERGPLRGPAKMFPLQGVECYYCLGVDMPILDGLELYDQERRNFDKGGV